MLIFVKRVVVVLSGIFLAVAGYCTEPFKLKGYYQEDGSYVRKRVIEPVSPTFDVPPSLSTNLKHRKKALRNYYEGKVWRTKVSFPASHKGVILRRDDFGQTNVDLFNDIKKYGSAIEKGEKAIITKFDIKSKVIDIELNNGGYGDAGDMTFRVVTGALSLGLTEFQDYQKKRTEQGSRLQIKLGKKDPTNKYPDTLNVDMFKKTLQNDTPTNGLILEQLSMEKGQLSSLSKEKLHSALENILMMPDFYQKIDLRKLDLSKKTRGLMKDAREVYAEGKRRQEKKIRKLTERLENAKRATTGVDIGIYKKAKRLKWKWEEAKKDALPSNIPLEKKAIRAMKNLEESKKRRAHTTYSQALHTRRLTASLARIKKQAAAERSRLDKRLKKIKRRWEGAEIKALPENNPKDKKVKKIVDELEMVKKNAIPGNRDQEKKITKLTKKLKKTLRSIAADSRHQEEAVLKFSGQLAKAKQALAEGTYLPEKKARKLNRGLLYALYPQEIRPRQNKFTVDNLNFETINEYLSMVLEL